MTEPPVRVVLTDIEGTTGSIAFVRDVLFPYADARLAAFVAENGMRPDVRALLSKAAEIAGIDPHDDAAIVGVLRTWIRTDKKFTPLKGIQGLIWTAGYERGELRGHVYDDAVAGLRRFSGAGVRLAVYSSGSRAAQQLLFRYSIAGDLTALFSDYFDTTSGGKTECASYERIAAALGVAPQDGLFLSDTAAELDAAADAGWRTIQLVRPGTAPAPNHDRVGSFAEIVLM